MWFFQLLILFAIVSVGPGLFFVRWWRLSPDVKLVISVAVSLLLLYMASFAVFALGWNSKCQWFVTGGCAVLTAASLSDLRRLLRERAVRHMLSAYALLVLWGLLLLAFVQSYGGGTWSGDWLEHFRRSEFFLGGTPRDFKFIDLFPLPARPPLMNVVAAHFLATVNSPGYDPFEVFQVAFVLLNALVLLPCCLVARELFRPTLDSTRRLPWMLLFLLAANPMFCQNLTYTWTKLFTMFYVLLGLFLYLRGWRRAERTQVQQIGFPVAADAATAATRRPNDAVSAPPVPVAPTALKTGSIRPLFVFAFASLSVGLLAHYSAGPYALFIGVHYLLFVWARNKWRFFEAAVIGSVCTAILATWFVWSLHAYGPKTTFASNSTVTDSAPMSPWGNVQNVGRNLLDTAIPTVLRHPSIMRSDVDLSQPTTSGEIRDFAFLCYQVSVPFGLGSLGIVGIAYLFYFSFFKAPQIGRRRTFWIAFIVVIYFLGVLVYGGKDRFGVAHICLQGLILLGICLLAAAWRRIPMPIRWLLMFGMAIDLAFGILLHFTLEGHDPHGRPGPFGAINWLSRAAQANRSYKEFFQLGFWGDSFAGNEGLLQFIVIVFFIVLAWMALRPIQPAAPVVVVQARPRGTPRRRSGRRSEKRASNR